MIYLMRKQDNLRHYTKVVVSLKVLGSGRVELRGMSFGSD